MGSMVLVRAKMTKKPRGMNCLFMLLHKTYQAIHSHVVIGRVFDSKYEGKLCRLTDSYKLTKDILYHKIYKTGIVCALNKSKS